MALDVGADAGPEVDDGGPADDAFVPLDIEDRLALIEGLTVRAIPSDFSGYRAFELGFRQPQDHADPGNNWFDERLILHHRDENAPMVLNATGYTLFDEYGQYLAEPAFTLGANQLLVEHRFFGPSRPANPDWSLLTVEQAAHDHHRIIEAFKTIYRGAWISTGVSKGGMTSVFHHRFYPDDLDGVIAYVAPISLGAPDPRYVSFLDQDGPEDCRNDLRAFQRAAIERVGEIVDLAPEHQRDTDEERTWLEDAVVYYAVEFEWFFWQYYGVAYCDTLPAPDAPASDFRDLLIEDFSWLDPDAEPYEDPLAPYDFQAETELGYPDTATAHLDDLLEGHDLDIFADYGLRPWGDETPPFRPEVMQDIAAWARSEGERMILIYGEYDPWTAGRIQLGETTDSLSFTAAAASHGACIGDLDLTAQQQIEAVLEDWVGTSVWLGFANRQANDAARMHHAFVARSGLRKRLRPIGSASGERP